MDVLEFIFVLGINFSIFGFIWGLIMLAVRMLRNQGQGKGKNQAFDYVLRIIKYFLLVSVTANYIVKFQDTGINTDTGYTHIILGVIVLGLYLLGKLQNRAMISQLANNPMVGRFMSKIDPKVERYLLIGSLGYFVICLLNPGMVDTKVVNWFTDSIVNIYDTPIIGWVFSVIAFFFLISIIFRGANVLGSLISGQPISTSKKSNVNFGGGRNPFENNPFQEKPKEDDGFTDYEDVTDEESEDDTKIE